MRRWVGVGAASIAALAVVSALPISARAASADPERAVETPAPRDVEEVLPPGAELGGRAIYDRLFKNRKRLRTAIQTGRILSKDPAGNPQETRFSSRAMDYRNAADEPTDGIFTKVLMTITGSRDENGGDTTVKTKILRGGPGDILVDYRMRQTAGTWKIIDVIIEGVSLVSNFRSQFQDVVASGGPERLLSLLRDKNAKGESLKTS